MPLIYTPIEWASLIRYLKTVNPFEVYEMQQFDFISIDEGNQLLLQDIKRLGCFYFLPGTLNPQNSNEIVFQYHSILLAYW